MTILVFAIALLGGIAIGIPIAFALILTSVVLMVYLNAVDLHLIALQMINGADSFPLLAVPFFLLAGEAMNAGGLSKRLVAFGLSLVGHLRGGLGYVTILAALLLASLSGSAIADTAVLAAMLIPVMRQAGYDVGRATGLVAAGGIIAPVLPPSIPFIVFGVAGGVSITKLFLAGIVPGLLMAVALAFTWWLINRKEAGFVPLPKRSWTETGRAALDAGLAFILPVIIVGGLRTGIFTPTEAGVVAAVYSIAIGVFVYRELTPSILYKAFVAAIETTAAVMFLVAAAAVTSYLITIANVPAEIGAWLGNISTNPTILMLIIMALVLVIGTSLDIIPTILILTPVLLPVVKMAGIDPVYFGVLFIMNVAISLITPPVGAVLSVACLVAKIEYVQALRGVVPFLIALLTVLLLLTLFPSIVMVPARWFY